MRPTTRRATITNETTIFVHMLMFSFRFFNNSKLAGYFAQDKDQSMFHRKLSMQKSFSSLVSVAEPSVNCWLLPVLLEFIQQSFKAESIQIYIQ